MRRDLFLLKNMANMLIIHFFRCFLVIPRLSISIFTAHSFELFTPRLGVEYSKSHIGLAFSSFHSPRPLLALKNSKNMTALALNVNRLAYLYRAREIIVGVPVEDNGVLSAYAVGTSARRCVAFARRLVSCAAGDTVSPRV